MGFSEAMEWWEEWQLRVLVLASLFLQYFLFAVAPLRKRCIPGWLRFLTWIAYLGSDAVAIYALATLFNRHKMGDWVSTHRSSVGLEALWAPVLLTHLGGQYGITAYNIEDNELWRRRVLTAFSQITVAIYVFHKSWSGDKYLLIVAMFIFVPGIMKCLDKPWTLKRANIVNSAAGPWFEYDYTRTNTDVINSLEEYVEAAAKRVQQSMGEDERHQHHGRPGKPNNLFVDLVPPYRVRLETLTFMVRRKPWVHLRLRDALSTMFDRLFTWQDPARIPGECSCRNLGMYSPRIVLAYGTVHAIIMLVGTDQKYNETDVKITYALLCCTAALELVVPGIKSCCLCICIGDERWLPWPDRAAQYSLIGYLDRNRRHRMLRRLASLLLCKDHLDQLWCMAPCRSAAAITELVYDHVVDGWASYIRSAGTYQRFSDFRGQWTLRRECCTGGGLITASLRRPFDETVLIWHLATDLCFHVVAEHDNNTAAAGEEEEEAAGRSRVISNYLVYLLFVNPEMLVAGARRSLFRDAYRELRDMALEESADSEAPSPQLRERKLAGDIMAKVSDDDGSGTGEFIRDAWALARELMDIGKQDPEGEAAGGDGGKKMWRVIQGVWVEMLCFSASRCRGYLHAKSLGKGGEYLSYVWLLMSYMGLEPLAEKLQRTTAEMQDERTPTSNGDD